MRVTAIVILSCALLNTAASNFADDDIKKILKLENEFKVTSNDTVEELETENNGTELWDKKTTVKKFIKKGLPENSKHADEKVIKEYVIEIKEDGSESILEKDMSFRKLQKETAASGKATSSSKSDVIQTKGSPLVNFNTPSAKSNLDSPLEPEEHRHTGLNRVPYEEVGSSVSSSANAGVDQSNDYWSPETNIHSGPRKNLRTRTENYASTLSKEPDVIVINNDNSEALLEIAKELANRTPPVTIIRGSNTKTISTEASVENIFDESSLERPILNNHNRRFLGPERHHNNGPANSLAPYPKYNIGDNYNKVTASAESEAKSTTEGSGWGDPLDSIKKPSPLYPHGRGASEARAESSATAGEGPDSGLNIYDHNLLGPENRHPPGPGRLPHEEVSSSVSSSATAFAEQSVDSLAPYPKYYTGDNYNRVTASAESEAKSTSEGSGWGGPLDSIKKPSPLYPTGSGASVARAVSSATAGVEPDSGLNIYDHNLSGPENRQPPGPGRLPHEEVGSSVSSSATAFAEQSVDSLAPYPKYYIGDNYNKVTASAESEAKSTTEGSRWDGPLDSIKKPSPLYPHGRGASEARSESSATAGGGQDLGLNTYDHNLSGPENRHRPGPGRLPHEEVSSSVSSSATAFAEQSVDSLAPYPKYYNGDNYNKVTASAESEAKSTTEGSRWDGPLDSIKKPSPLYPHGRGASEARAVSSATAGDGPDSGLNIYDHNLSGPENGHRPGPGRLPHEEVGSSVSSSANAFAEQSVDSLAPYPKYYIGDNYNKVTASAESEAKSTTEGSRWDGPLDSIKKPSPLYPHGRGASEARAESSATAGGGPDLGLNIYDHNLSGPKNRHRPGPGRLLHEEVGSSVSSSATAFAEQSVDSLAPYPKYYTGDNYNRVTASAESEAKSTSEGSGWGGPLDSIKKPSPLYPHGRGASEASAESSATAGGGPDLGLNIYDHKLSGPENRHRPGPGRLPHEEVGSSVSSSANAFAKQSVDSLAPYPKYDIGDNYNKVTASAESEASTTEGSGWDGTLDSIKKPSPLYPHGRGASEARAESSATAGGGPDLGLNIYDHNLSGPENRHRPGPGRLPHEEVGSSVSSSATAFAEQSVDSLAPYPKYYTGDNYNRVTASAESEAKSTSEGSGWGGPLDSIKKPSPLYPHGSGASVARAVSSATAGVGPDSGLNIYDHNLSGPENRQPPGPGRLPHEEVGSSVSSSATAFAEQSVDSLAPYPKYYIGDNYNKVTASAESEASTTEGSGWDGPLDSIKKPSPLYPHGRGASEARAESSATAGGGPDLGLNIYDHNLSGPENRHRPGPGRLPHEEVGSSVSSSATAFAEQSVDSLAPYPKYYTGDNYNRVTASAESEAKSTSEGSGWGGPLDSIKKPSPLYPHGSGASVARAVSSATAGVGPDSGLNIYDHNLSGPENRQPPGPGRLPHEEVGSSVSSSATAFAEQSVDSLAPYPKYYIGDNYNKVTASAESEASTTEGSGWDGPLDSIKKPSPLYPHGRGASEARAESSATAGGGPDLGLNIYDHNLSGPENRHRPGPGRLPNEEVGSSVSSSATAFAEQSVDSLAPYPKYYTGDNYNRVTASAESEAKSTSEGSGWGGPLDSIKKPSPLYPHGSGASKARAVSSATAGGGPDLGLNIYDHNLSGPENRHRPGPGRLPHEEVGSSVSSSATAFAEQSVDSLAPYPKYYTGDNYNRVTASAESEAKSTSEGSGWGGPLDSIKKPSPLYPHGSGASVARAVSSATAGVGPDSGLNIYDHNLSGPENRQPPGPGRLPHEEVGSSVSSSATAFAKQSVDSLAPYPKYYIGDNYNKVTASAESEAKSTTEGSRWDGPLDSIKKLSPLYPHGRGASEARAESSATAGGGPDLGLNIYDHNLSGPENRHRPGPGRLPHEEVGSSVSSSATAFAEQSVDSLAPYPKYYIGDNYNKVTASAESEAKSTTEGSRWDGPLDSIKKLSPLYPHGRGASEARAESSATAGGGPDLGLNIYDHNLSGPENRHRPGPGRLPHEEVGSSVSSSANVFAEQSVDSLGDNYNKVTASAESEAKSTTEGSRWDGPLDSIKKLSPLYPHGRGASEARAESSATAGGGPDLGLNIYDHNLSGPENRHRPGPGRLPHEEVGSSVSSSATAFAEQSVDSLAPYPKYYIGDNYNKVTASADSEAKSTTEGSSWGGPLDSIKKPPPLYPHGRGASEARAESSATAGGGPDLGLNIYDHNLSGPENRHRPGPGRLPHEEVGSSVSSSATAFAEQSVDSLAPYPKYYTGDNYNRVTASAESEAKSTSEGSGWGGPLDSIKKPPPLYPHGRGASEARAESSATAGGGPDLGLNIYDHNLSGPENRHRPGPGRLPHEEVGSSVSSSATAFAEQSVDSLAPYPKYYTGDNYNRVTASAESEAKSTSEGSGWGGPLDSIKKPSPLYPHGSGASEARAESSATAGEGPDSSLNIYDHNLSGPENRHPPSPGRLPHEEVGSSVSSSATAFAEQSVDSLAAYPKYFIGDNYNKVTASAESEAKSTTEGSRWDGPVDSIKKPSPLYPHGRGASEARAESSATAGGGPDLGLSIYDHNLSGPENRHRPGPGRLPHEEVGSSVSSSATAFAEQSVDSLAPYPKYYIGDNYNKVTASAESKAKSTTEGSSWGGPLDSIQKPPPLYPHGRGASEARAESSATAGGGPDLGLNIYDHNLSGPENRHRPGPGRLPHEEVGSSVSSSATAFAEQSVDSLAPYLKYYTGDNYNRVTASAESEAKSTSEGSGWGGPLDSIKKPSPLYPHGRGASEARAESSATAGGGPDLGLSIYDHNLSGPENRDRPGPGRFPHEEVGSSVSSSATAFAEQSVDLLAPYPKYYTGDNYNRVTASAESEAKSTSEGSGWGGPLDSIKKPSPLYPHGSGASEARAESSATAGEGPDSSLNIYDHNLSGPENRHPPSPGRLPHEEVGSSVSSSATAFAEQSVDSLAAYPKYFIGDNYNKVTASAESEAKSTTEGSRWDGPVDSIKKPSPLYPHGRGASEARAESSATAGGGPDLGLSIYDHNLSGPENRHRPGPGRLPHEEVGSSVSSSATAFAEQSVDSLAPYPKYYIGDNYNKVTASAESKAKSTTEGSSWGGPLDSIKKPPPLYPHGRGASEARAESSATAGGGPDLGLNIYDHNLSGPENRHRPGPGRLPHEEVGSSVSSSATAFAEQSVDSLAPYLKYYTGDNYNRVTASAESEAKSTSEGSGWGGPLDSIKKPSPLYPHGRGASEARAESSATAGGGPDLGLSIYDHNLSGPENRDRPGPGRLPHEEVGSSVSSSATAFAEQSVDLLAPYPKYYTGDNYNRVTASAESEAKSTSEGSGWGGPLDSIKKPSPLYPHGSGASEARAESSATAGEGPDSSLNIYDHNLSGPENRHPPSPGRLPHEEVGSSVSSSATAFAEQSVDSLAAYPKYFIGDNYNKVTASAESEAKSTTEGSRWDGPVDSIKKPSPLYPHGRGASEARAESSATAGGGPDLGLSIYDHNLSGPENRHRPGPGRLPHEEVGSSVSSSATAFAEQSVDLLAPYPKYYTGDNYNRVTASAESEAKSTSEGSGWGGPLDSIKKPSPLYPHGSGASEARAESSATAGEGPDSSLNIYDHNLSGPENRHPPSPGRLPHEEVGSSVSSSATAFAEQSVDSLAAYPKYFIGDNYNKVTASAESEAKSSTEGSRWGGPLDSIKKPSPLYPHGRGASEARAETSATADDGLDLFSRRRGGHRLSCHLSRRQFLVKIGTRRSPCRTC